MLGYGNNKVVTIDELVLKIKDFLDTVWKIFFIKSNFLKTKLIQWLHFLNEIWVYMVAFSK
jgi:hypothetical protein